MNVWTSLEGLPSKSLTCVTQVSDGYLWIGSYNGLYQFDGLSFKSYVKGNDGVLRTNSFGKALQAPDGRLLIATGGSGLITLQDGKLRVWGDTSKRFSHPIESFLPEADGRIWVGSRGSGLFLFEQDTFRPYHPSPLLADVTVSAIIKDRRGRYWFATEKHGMVVLENGQARQISTEQGLVSKQATDVMEDRQGRIWVATVKGLHRIDADGSISLLEGTQGYFINKLLEDAHGSLWIGSTRGLFRLNAATKALEFTDESGGLPHGNILDMELDQEGNLWLATQRGGLARLRDTRFENYGARHGIAGGAVSALCELGPERFLVATNDNLYILDKQELAPFKFKTNLPSARIKHVMRHSNKQVLVSTYSGLLSIGADGTERLLDNRSGLPDNQVRLAFEDASGNIWIGTRAGGLIKCSPSLDILQVLDSRTGLSSDFIMSISQDGDGTMIIGTNNQGLDLLAPDGSKRQFGIEQLGSNLVFNAYADRQGHIWVATNAGLALIMPDRRTVYHITQADGLGSDIIFDLVDDGKGNWWCTSPEGLIVVNRQQLLDFAQGKASAVSSRILTKEDGMVETECTGVTQSLKGSDGNRLYFPTLGGLTVYNLSYPLPQASSFPVYVPVAIVDGVEMPLHKAELRLPSDTRRVSLRYAALYLTAPKEVSYRYRMDGYEGWVLGGSDRQAIYTNISPGWHTFRVEATLPHLDSDRPAGQLSVRIYRAPHFTETWAFYVLASLGVMGAAWALYTVRMRRMRLRNLALERLVQQRTSELQDKNDQLHLKQEEIMTQNEELHQQQDEIMAQRDYIEQKNQELSLQKSNLERAYQNVRLLTEIGQEITSILDLPAMVRHAYERVNRLMDASGFGIALFDAQQQALVFNGYIEKGAELPSYQAQYLPEQNLASWCYSHRREILINDLVKEIGLFLPNQEAKALAGEIPRSLIYVPLLQKGKAIGVITVQSFSPNSYSQNDVTILRNLAAYLAVAVDNASAYEEVNASRSLLERKNKDIMDSLRYAETIQQSVLPSQEQLERAFQGHFVIFKPKDVVSGDFYWFKEVEGRIFVAVVDCTGHGVPGAFMSLIGNDLLDALILRDHIYDPALVLQGMHEGIRRALHQDERLNSDGMDLALCMIERHGGGAKLVFAGAKRSLYYRSQGALHDLAADRKSVGGWQKEDVPTFTNRSVELQPGDVLYLSTDGYVDQSAPNRKRLGSKRLRELLESFGDISMAQQHQMLLDELASHQGDQEQRDDITVLGLQL